MTTENTVIRDFIYIDGDRLYSLYSQIKKGVAEQIVESRLHGTTREKTQEGTWLQGNKLEAQLTEAKHSSESKVLHDYMYVELEGMLKNALVTPENVTSKNYTSKLNNIFMIKVSGSAEIADYSRIREVVKNFNSIVEGVHYMEEAAAIGGNPSRMKNLVRKGNLPDKKSLLEFLNKFDKPKEFADEKGMLQDEKLLKYFENFMSNFYTEGIEITILPDNKKDAVVYRCLIDKQWLRIQPESIRHLYGAYSEAEWTMVGQITYLPDSTNPDNSIPKTSLTDEEETQLEQTIADLNSDDITPAQNKPSIRGGFTQLLKALRDMEKELLVNSERVEVVVAPLAIYREMTIPVEASK